MADLAVLQLVDCFNSLSCTASNPPLGCDAGGRKTVFMWDLAVSFLCVGLCRRAESTVGPEFENCGEQLPYSGPFHWRLSLLLGAEGGKLLAISAILPSVAGKLEVIGHR